MKRSVLDLGDPRNTMPCSRCGTPTPVDLLDAKPSDPAKPDSCDWTVLECEPCYGPGWAPMATAA